MELKIIKPKLNNIKLKLTLQKTGKLGFSAECNRLFNLDENRYVKFATDSENNPYLVYGNPQYNNPNIK
ncbi:hypothetical protein [Chryseobacterium sp.]|uniref:hypothetical protein n=1 Tax=Chryseobacterium sp. TaxID=1871047 RepID=UPI0028A20A14|nr:hypothetical protein [Chryseobacterium sp.]